MNFKFGMLIISANVFILFKGCYGIITQRPQNAASDVKGSVTFHCTTDALYIVAWVFSKNSSTYPGQYESITNDKCEVQSNYTNNYSSDPPGSSTKICNLNVFDIHKDLGGAYTCVDSGFPNAISIALLTVVDSASQRIEVHASPHCDAAYSTEVSCSIDYSGSVSPALLLPPSLNLTSESNSAINMTEVVLPNTVTKYVTFGVSSPGSIGPLHCVAYFNAPQNPTQPPYINNAPENKYSTTVPATSLPMFNPASNVRISGRNCFDGICYCENGTSTALECIADGCPRPNIAWSVKDGNSSTLDVEGSTLNATFNGRFRCTATNSFNDSSSFNATADVTVSGCGNEATTMASVTYYTNSNVTGSGNVNKPVSGTGDDPVVVTIAVLVTHCGLCILTSVIFLIFYGSSRKHRSKLNGSCPHLEDMLSCLNGKGCSAWIIVTVLIAVLASIFCVPALLILTYCCNHQGAKSKQTEPRIEVQQFSSIPCAATPSPGDTYETLHQPTSPSFYQALSLQHQNRPQVSANRFSESSGNRTQQLSTTESTATPGDAYEPLQQFIALSVYQELTHQHIS